MQILESDSSDGALRALSERLHGSFGIYYRDPGKGVSLCLADRIASRPIYKFWDGKRWIISSHANAIAFMVPEIKIDPGALGAFLLYAGPLEPRKSLYGGVEALTPGSITKLGDAGAVEESRWYRFCHKPDNQMSLPAWIDLAAERLTHSASRIARQSKRPVIFFSGGVDSRLAAAVLKSAGANPLLVTLGDSRNIEVRVAQQAAKALDMKHVVILRDNHWVLAVFAKTRVRDRRKFPLGARPFCRRHWQTLVRNTRATLSFWAISVKPSASCYVRREWTRAGR